jgi:hypothetical protein
MSSITFSDERIQLTANVRPASYRDDCKRMDMQEQATTQAYPDNNIAAVAMFTYPRLIAATPSGALVIEGTSIEWPPTLDQLMDISVEAIDLWYLEVKRLNVAWFPDPAEFEKKVLGSVPTSDSSSSTSSVP